MIKAVIIFIYNIELLFQEKESTNFTASYKAFLKSDNIADDIPLVFEPAEGSRAH